MYKTIKNKLLKLFNFSFLKGDEKDIIEEENKIKLKDFSNKPVSLKDIKIVRFEVLPSYNNFLDFDAKFCFDCYPCHHCKSKCNNNVGSCDFCKSCNVSEEKNLYLQYTESIMKRKKNLKSYRRS